MACALAAERPNGPSICVRLAGCWLAAGRDSCGPRASKGPQRERQRAIPRRVFFPNWRPISSLGCQPASYLLAASERQSPLRTLWTSRRASPEGRQANNWNSCRLAPLWFPVGACSLQLAQQHPKGALSHCAAELAHSPLTLRARGLQKSAAAYCFWPLLGLNLSRSQPPPLGPHQFICRRPLGAGNRV